MDLTWYNTINKPALNPPPEIFGPVWAFMYTLIFISFTTFMYAKTDLNKKQGLTFFLIQLLLNFSWSPAFFYLHDIYNYCIFTNFYYSYNNFFLQSFKNICISTNSIFTMGKFCNIFKL